MRIPIGISQTSPRTARTAEMEMQIDVHRDKQHGNIMLAISEMDLMSRRSAALSAYLDEILKEMVRNLAFEYQDMLRKAIFAELSSDAFKAHLRAYAEAQMKVWMQEMTGGLSVRHSNLNTDPQP